MGAEFDIEGSSTSGTLLRSFLLGELPEEDAYVEDKLLRNPEYVDELLVAEDDLFDDYVSGSLLPEEEERFTALFLRGEEGRNSLMFARALADYLPRLARESDVVKVDPSNRESLASALATDETGRNAGPENNAASRENSEWESILSEAETNRKLMKLLTSHNWRGLELLAEIRARFVPLGTPGMPASDTDHAIISGMTEAGLVNGEPGDYSCSLLGLSILERIESGSGISLE